MNPHKYFKNKNVDKLLYYEEKTSTTQFAISKYSLKKNQIYIYIFMNF